MKHGISILLGIFVILFLLLLLKTWVNVRERYQVSQYLHHKSKCFDCEAQMIALYGESAAWLANPAKSFYAESEAVAQHDEDIGAGFLAKTLKYYHV